MIREVEISEDMNFPTTANEMKCFEFSDSKGPCIHVGIEVINESCSIHLSIKRFSHNIVKQARTDFEYIKTYLASTGVVRIIASFPDEETNKWWSKLIKLFGFKEPIRIMTSIMEI